MRSRAPPPIEWRYHSGDTGSKRFSPATQIDSSNVSDLRMTWRWRAPDWDLYRDQYLEYEEGYENQSTPLMVDGVLYVSTPLNTIAALNAETGEQIWSFDNLDVWHASEYMGSHRGVTYWSDGKEEHILLGTDTTYLWVFDLNDRHLIHRLELPAAGSATPMSYAINGRQYIVVPLGDADTPPEYAAYALPHPEEKLPQQGEHRTDAEHPLFYEAVHAFDDADSTEFAQMVQEHPELARDRGYLDPHYKYPQLRGATLLHHIAGEPMSRGELKGNVVAAARLLLKAGRTRALPPSTPSTRSLSSTTAARPDGWASRRS